MTVQVGVVVTLAPAALILILPIKCWLSGNQGPVIRQHRQNEERGDDHGEPR